MRIKRISKEETWELRQRVMWLDREIQYVQLPEDDLGIHWGLYKEDRLLSVVSLFIDGNQGQFRKFATEIEEQGKGYGSRLFAYMLQEAKDLGVKKIWCNARKNKTSFYEKFGMLETSQEFERDGKLYVIMEMKL